jgi:hypothetical protein
MQLPPPGPPGGGGGGGGGGEPPSEDPPFDPEEWDAWKKTYGTAGFEVGPEFPAGSVAAMRHLSMLIFGVPSTAAGIYVLAQLAWGGDDDFITWRRLFPLNLMRLGEIPGAYLVQDTMEWALLKLEIEMSGGTIGKERRLEQLTQRLQWDIPMIGKYLQYKDLKEDKMEQELRSLGVDFPAPYDPMSSIPTPPGMRRSDMQTTPGLLDPLEEALDLEGIGIAPGASQEEGE